MRAVVLVAPLLALAAVPAGRADAAVAATAADVACGAPAPAACVVTDPYDVPPGAVLDFGARALVVKRGAALKSTGAMTVRAGSVTLDGGLLSAPGGTVNVEATAGDIKLVVNARTPGRIDVGPGSATLSAPHGEVVVDGEVAAKGGAGTGGTVLASGRSLTVNGTIDVRGDDTAEGGAIDLSATAGPMTLAGALLADGGEGGSIECAADGHFRAAGTVSAQATGPGGSGGLFEVMGGDAVVLQAGISLRGIDGPDGGGDGGTLNASADGSITLDGEVDLSSGPGGLGGDATLDSQLDVLFTDRGALSAFARGEAGEGGGVRVYASREIVAGAIDAAGAGLAGTIDVMAWCSATLPAGRRLRAVGPAATTAPEVTVAASDVVEVAGRISATAGIRLATRPGGTVTWATNVGTFPDPIPDAEDITLVPCGGAVPSGCGNGAIDAGEQCDDGDAASCDGCSSTCRREGCGNGVVDCGEACDDGNTVACDGCDATCSRVDGVCGDGTAECGEEADDGNVVNCDGVSSACRIERCGNGVVECSEACDDVPPSATCSAACVARSPLCGNGAVDAGEQCDDGGAGDCDGCSALCTFERAGNGVVDCGEECDDGNTVACDGCGPGGRIEACGNGAVDCGEECDAGAANGTADSGCLAERCVRGALCAPGVSEPCLACAADTDCGPTGRCGGDACVAGACVSVAPLACGDGDACTTDACSPTAGCTHAPAACDDANPCTADACDAAAGCTHAPVACDDADPCTTDTCDAATGCRHVPAACDDGNPCTADACAPGTGCAHTAVACDDGDTCTDDACDPASGCAHVRRTGSAGLACFLDVLAASLDAAPDPGLGRKTRKRLARLVRAMRAKGAPLATPDSARAARAERRVLALRAKAEQTIRRARDVQPDTAAALLALLARLPPLT